MSIVKNRVTADQPRIVLPVRAAFGVSTWDTCAAGMHATALVTGATPGTSVWSPPPC
jgi:hypothetical protein